MEEHLGQSKWIRWFKDDVEDDAILAEEEIERARAWLAMADSEPFLRHMRYIENEINRPYPIGQQLDMISTAVRGNTFKEIKEQIRKATEQAKSLLSADRENNGRA